MKLPGIDPLTLWLVEPHSRNSAVEMLQPPPLRQVWLSLPTFPIYFLFCDRRSQIILRYVSAETRCRHLLPHARPLQHRLCATQTAVHVRNATNLVRVSVGQRRTHLPGMSTRNSTNNASSAPMQPFQPPLQIV